jgi:hypothetical protein
MSKEKIGKLYRQRIVKGPKNSLLPGEIHIDDVIKNTDTETGGGESGGECSLAKPNGYYWKFKFVNQHYVNVSKLSEQELGALNLFYELQALVRFIHSALFCSGSIDADYTDVVSQIYYRIGGMPAFLYAIDKGQEVDIVSFNESLLYAWSECSVIIDEDADTEGVIGKREFSFIDIMKAIAPEFGMEATDENAMALISEVLMLEPITKEYYETIPR